MLNKYEQGKQIRNAVHRDMETRVDKEARTCFTRIPYQEQNISIKSMLAIKKDINYLLSRARMLDDWEQETIRRIVKRIQEGSKDDGDQTDD